MDCLLNIQTSVSQAILICHLQISLSGRNRQARKTVGKIRTFLSLCLYTSSRIDIRAPPYNDIIFVNWQRGFYHLVQIDILQQNRWFVLLGLIAIPKGSLPHRYTAVCWMRCFTYAKHFRSILFLKSNFDCFVQNNSLRKHKNAHVTDDRIKTEGTVKYN